MKIIKKSKPKFYDCICNKCKAEFLYQLEDVQEEEMELPEEMQSFITSFLPTKIYSVTCPCCNNKIRTGGNGLNLGIGFGGNG